MRLFNAFQCVSFFVAAPFGLSWLNEQTFKGADVGFWAGACVYVVGFCFMVGAVYSATDPRNR